MTDPMDWQAIEAEDETGALDEGTRDEGTLAALGVSVQPVAPPAGLRSRLMARLTAGPVAEVRAGEGQWLPLGPPGVERRMLYRDPGTGQKTYLLRMAPGATLPSHPHKTVEQCLVLEGDIGWEGARYEAGDFVAVAGGTIHTEVRSEQGAVLFIVGG